ncbi:multicopper oxidase domain-containing protein [Cohnella sp. CFH 77786]|uniref:multicopper oxidase family protein n=1 Tax=Cohnella sp. CFH 77786 TaxID=2662265 RepID=UPI001C609EAC|nr:multicopper oxidase family protein [Cohnella sp. CFH 77786]MBW5445999.1 multicopper oxidase domain-containing protein [Cohnella sp. CFH 77786]
MYGSLTGMELGFTLLSVICAWIAANKASNAVYGAAKAKLSRNIRGTTVWAAIAAIPALAAILSIAGIAATQPPLFWKDRLLIQAPLIGFPLLVVWGYSLPNLWRLKRNSLRSPGAPDRTIRSALAAPGVIAPFQAAALGAATALYFVLVVPSPFRPLQGALPLFLCVLAVTALWMLHDGRWQRALGGSTEFERRLWRRTLAKLGVICVAAGLAGIAVNAGMQNSRLPEHLNMASGPMDFGGGTALSHDVAQAVSVAMLTGPRKEQPDRRISLTAEKKTVRLSSGKTVDAWTFNGEVPGPEMRFRQGELVEVTLTNRDIDEGVTIHWHGLDVPNAEDGVAGATQDAVMPGQSHVYRFRAEQAGTFWYHSHQHSQEAVSKGLFGALIVEPADSAKSSRQQKDFTVISHLWDDSGFAIGANDGVWRETVAPGTQVRLRLINTDDWVRQTYRLSGTPFRVAAIDGTELTEPGELRDAELRLTTGGRYDVTFEMPDRPVYLSVGRDGKLGLLISPDGKGDVPALEKASSVFDPTHYGKRTEAPFGPDSEFDRHFTMVLDNKLGFYDGSWNFVYTMNGKVFPNTPMFMVREGDLVKVTIVNRGSVDHPMHLHGHHALVLSRNGETADGSLWWSDTLDVQPGESYEIAFRADNPGLWMDHCHNLTHAAVGMTMHLMYEGVSTPYAVGSETANRPE